MSTAFVERPFKRRRTDDSNTEAGRPSPDPRIRGLKMEEAIDDSAGRGEPVDARRTGAAVDAGPGGPAEPNAGPVLEGTVPPPAGNMLSPRSSVWFEDGNCFVIAGHSVSRLYRGLLDMHSSVFKHMLSNKCYYVSPDSGSPILTIPAQPFHAEVMLRWILGERPLDELSLTHVSACYELGVAYQIENLHASAGALLRTRYPAKLSSWQQATSTTELAVVDHLFIASITAALGEAKIASVALYEALDNAGFGAVLSDLDNLPRSQDVKPQRVDRLKAAVITGDPLLVAFQGRTYSELLNADECPGCTSASPGACLEAMRAAVGTFVYNADQIHAFSQHEYTACEECKEAYDVILKKRMKLLYKRLPEYFGLVTPTGEGIPEPSTARAVFFPDDQPPLPPSGINAADGVADADKGLLSNTDHVDFLLEIGRAQEKAALELVAAAQRAGEVQ